MHISDRTKEAPEIAAKMLWYENWYDGPTDGVCEFEGEKFWFVWTDGEDDHTRIYAVTRIDPEVLAEMVRRHEIYRDICGPHTDYGIKCEGGG